MTAQTPRQPKSLTKRIVFRLVAAVIAPAAILCLLEIGLRLGGVGVSTHFYVSDSTVDGKVYRANREFTRPYFPEAMIRRPTPFVLPAGKSADAYRVFVLGASAAMGDPEPAYSIGRMLEVMLESAYPDVPFEVVNAAITAINSHVVVGIARDCADLSPDLVIVYLGNNEVIGPYGPGTVFSAFLRSRPAIRASMAARRTRASQWLGRLRAPEEAEQWSGLNMFAGHRLGADDPRLDTVYCHYRDNLRAIYHAAHGAGVLLCTVSCNLKDQPPFAGVAARDAYEKGLQLYGAGQYESAREALVQARDLDELRFRADSRINEVVRDLAGNEGPGLQLVDLEQAMTRLSPHGITDQRFFFDHVHFTFDGTHAAASILFAHVAERLRQSGRVSLEMPEPASRDELARRLAFTTDGQYRIDQEVHARLTAPPFAGLPGIKPRVADLAARMEQSAGQIADPAGRRKILNVYRKALEWRPNDWYLLRDAGKLWTTLDRNLAIQLFEAALEIHPQRAELKFLLGKTLIEAGQTEEGRNYLLQVAESMPRHFHPLYNILGELATKDEDDDQAVVWLTTAGRFNPDNAAAFLTLSEVHLRRGDVAKAQEATHQGIRKSSDDHPLLYRVGKMYLRYDQPDIARTYFARALRLDPQNPTYLEAVENTAVRPVAEPP